MALILAPYNNAMRLGQGFNTYTQQICIDDAVVVDPERAENILTNDGATMRILVQAMGRPSAWSRQKEIVADDIPELEHEDAGESQPAPGKKKITSAVPRVSQRQSVPAIAKTSTEAPAENMYKGTEKGDAIENEAKDDTDGSSGVLVESAAAVEHDAQQKPQIQGEGEGETPAQSNIETSLAVSADGQQSKKQSTALSDEQEKRELMAAEKERERERRAEQAEIAKEKREQDKVLRNLRQQERLAIEKEKIEHEQFRREETKKLVAAAASMQGFTKDELKEMQTKVDFEPRFTGMGENKQDFEFDSSEPSGPSQVVTYTSRFIDKLSDITDDMNISGSLSIKAGKFGGSGRGAFIDSDKFKESDLNFYISVKVVNQTINFKDALQFNPVRSVDKDNFREVFGDGFISGFQEGGEFNALVSMKILNKAKTTDIKAEAKVAFTTGPVDITAEANVNIAKANIETNTETTIQVSWSGGGHIKPREQQWDVQSLMQAAARFPDLVAQCPQRTYAIITKYDSLRSFVKTKPAGYTKLQYENAQMYTNAMMDSYMGYKSLYTKLGSYVFDVQSKLKTIKPWDESTAPPEAVEEPVKHEPQIKDPDAVKDYSKDTFRFEASLKGLEDGKKAIRRQMAVIVNEVDRIEKDPKKATDDDHTEPFQSPAAFEARVPIVEPVEKPKPAAPPLGGKRIMTKTQTSDEHAEEEEAAAQAGPKLSDSEGLSADEKTALDALQAQRVDLGLHLRLSAPVGSETQGTPFTNLDFLLPEWLLTKIEVGIADGQVAGLSLYYSNGLIVSRGKSRDIRWVEMKDFRSGERVTGAAITTGVRDGATEKSVLSLQLFTNRGRNLIGQAEKIAAIDSSKQNRDGVTYSNTETRYFDMPIAQGTLKGIFGRSDDSTISRLGLIWGDLPKPETVIETNQTDVFTAVSVAQAGELQAAMRGKDETYNAMVRQKDAEIQEVKRHLLDWGGRSGAWRRDRVEIYFILYGGRMIWDEGAAYRFLDLAHNNWEFEFNDPVFGQDPWEGQIKSGAILYRYDGVGEMRCLAARQHDRVRFDRLP